METYFRLVRNDADGNLKTIEFFPTREGAEAASDENSVIDQGHFEGFSFVKD